MPGYIPFEGRPFLECASSYPGSVRPTNAARCTNRCPGLLLSALATGNARGRQVWCKKDNRKPDRDQNHLAL